MFGSLGVGYGFAVQTDSSRSTTFALGSFSLYDFHSRVTSGTEHGDGYGLKVSAPLAALAAGITQPLLPSSLELSLAVLAVLSCQSILVIAEMCSRLAILRTIESVRLRLKGLVADTAKFLAHAFSVTH